MIFQEKLDIKKKKKVFDYLKDTLEYDMFYDLFKCILTDNGSEFSNPEYIEDNGSEVLRTHVFYCDPKQSQQKGKIEVCYEIYLLMKSLPYSSQTNSLNYEINSKRLSSLFIISISFKKEITSIILS